LSERIGVLGGTFNPVHTGHLILARDAAEQFSLDRVLFMPCAQPSHKPASRLAPARRRVAMLRAAVRGEPRFQVSTLEIERGGISYSVDTLRELRRRHPRADFFFVIGGDTVGELPSWKSMGELLRLCTFVAMRRPGFTASRRIPVKRFRGHLVEISSSEIRARRAKGLSIRHLVPPGVERYITTKKMYLTKE
jgi:nicotinate-nucleotide adenylyltransferase